MKNEEKEATIILKSDEHLICEFNGSALILENIDNINPNDEMFYHEKMLCPYRCDGNCKSCLIEMDDIACTEHIEERLIGML